MKKSAMLALVLILSTTSSACLGKFALTTKLLTWNEGLGNKYLSSVVFWAFLIIPVYGATTFIDAVVLNLIEFWSGKNPLASADGRTTRTLTAANGQQIRMTFANGGRDVRIEGDGRVVAMHLESTHATVEDANGNVLTEGMMLPSGGFEIRDASGLVVVQRDGADTAALADLLAGGTDGFLQQYDVARGTRVASAQ